MHPIALSRMLECTALCLLPSWTCGVPWRLLLGNAIVLLPLPSEITCCCHARPAGELALLRPDDQPLLHCPHTGARHTPSAASEARAGAGAPGGCG
jgi:hypothetical protein